MQIILVLIVMDFMLSACEDQSNENSVVEAVSNSTETEQKVISEADESVGDDQAETEQPISSFIPSFEDYGVNRPEFNINPDLDITEYEDKLYKNILLTNYNHMPNLAYKYILIPVQCGANCQTNFIANKETGKIIDDIGSTWGVKTKLNSALIIADDYNTPLDKPYFENALTEKIRYYIVEDDEVKLISEVLYQDYYNEKKVDQ